MRGRFVRRANVVHTGRPGVAAVAVAATTTSGGPRRERSTSTSALRVGGRPTGFRRCEDAGRASNGVRSRCFNRFAWSKRSTPYSSRSRECVGIVTPACRRLRRRRNLFAPRHSALRRAPIGGDRFRVEPPTSWRRIVLLRGSPTSQIVAPKVGSGEAGRSQPNEDRGLHAYRSGMPPRRCRGGLERPRGAVERIAELTAPFLSRGWPVIGVGTQKKDWFEHLFVCAHKLRAT